MRVARGHRKVAMAQDGGYSDQVRACFSHTSSGGVAQVVKVEVHNACLLYSPGECVRDAVGLPLTYLCKYALALALLVKLYQQLAGFLVDRNETVLAGLGLSHGDDSTLEVHLLPQEVCDLAQAHAGVEGKHH